MQKKGKCMEEYRVGVDRYVYYVTNDNMIKDQNGMRFSRRRQTKRHAQLNLVHLTFYFIHGKT